MKILSIDVGMKNLAYCLFECDHDPTNANQTNQTNQTKDPDSMMQLVHIIAWDTVNLCDASITDAPIAVPVLCTYPGCKFAAKFAHSPPDADADADAIVIVHYCTRHANASGYKMPLPSALGSPKSLKKMGLDELKAFSGEYLSASIPVGCEKSKVKLLQHLNAAVASEYLVAVSAKPKVISAASVDLITIGRNMHKRFDALPHLASGVDVVIIENQLSTLATRMKTLQGMITQYFIMRGVPDIRFISATNKLKPFSKGLDNGDNEGKGEGYYADRKKRSIEITRALITAHAPLLVMKFEKHKKKDDLADCFLQGMWWLSETLPSGERKGTMPGF